MVELPEQIERLGLLRILLEKQQGQESLVGMNAIIWLAVYVVTATKLTIWLLPRGVATGSKAVIDGCIFGAVAICPAREPLCEESAPELIIRVRYMSLLALSRNCRHVRCRRRTGHPAPNCGARVR